MRRRSVALSMALGVLVCADVAMASRVPPPRPYATHHHRAQRHKAHPGAQAAPAAAPAPAPAQKEEKVEEVEQVESIETVEPVSEPSAAAATGTGPAAATGAAAQPPVPEAIRLAGHLHAASVHLPIAYILLWAAIVVLGPTLGMVSLNALARPLVWVAAVSFAPAISTGLARWTELATGGNYDDAPVLKHRNLMFIALGATLVGIVFTEIQHRLPNRVTQRLLQLVAIAAAGLVAYSAHLGGQLVYGDDFLPF